MPKMSREVKNVFILMYLVLFLQSKTSAYRNAHAQTNKTDILEPIVNTKKHQQIQTILYILQPND